MLFLSNLLCFYLTVSITKFGGAVELRQFFSLISFEINSEAVKLGHLYARGCGYDDGISVHPPPERVPEFQLCTWEFHRFGISHEIVNFWSRLLYARSNGGGVDVASGSSKSKEIGMGGSGLPHFEKFPAWKVVYLEDISFKAFKRR